MKELIINEYGFGKCELKKNDTTVYLTVLRTSPGLYNLSISRNNGFTFWVKENCKRLSTIQKYLDSNDYGITIKEL